MQQTELQTLLSASTLAGSGSIAQAFNTATPFKHVIVDDFFDPAFAAALVHNFPAFDPSKAVDEYGGKSRKAVVESLSELASPFREADNFFASVHFLDWLSTVTGIPGLLYNPDNYGGGTHENLEGQELLPHVDFNYHPKTGHHRRLNLIVYLNEGWQEEWGGSIQVHSNPRDPYTNEVRSFAPLFNRCIIFETNERSWHGFDRIKLPDTQKRNSRKSLSIYLYTAERPAEESFAPHGTFYVPRPLPADFVPGKVLSSEDIATLQYLLRTRDDLIELQQNKEADREGAAAKLARYSAAISDAMQGMRLPLLGYAKQLGPVQGVFPDLWMGSHANFIVIAVRPVTRISLRGKSHPNLPKNATLAIAVDESVVARVPLCQTVETMAGVSVRRAAGTTFRLDLKVDATVTPAAQGLSEDRRDLAFHLYDITFEHE